MRRHGGEDGKAAMVASSSSQAGVCGYAGCARLTTVTYSNLRPYESMTLLPYYLMTKQIFPQYSDLASLPTSLRSLHHHRGRGKGNCIYVEDTIQSTLFTRSSHSPRQPPVRRPHLHPRF